MRRKKVAPDGVGGEYEEKNVCGWMMSRWRWRDGDEGVEMEGRGWVDEEVDGDE